LFLERRFPIPSEPSIKRTIAFVDGQNLFYAAKSAFGYTYPNYNVNALANKICEMQGWQLDTVRFYTGIPDINDNAYWHGFWANKLGAMGRSVKIYSRPLRYRNQTVDLPDGTQFSHMVGEEKGIDVRIAIDVVRNAHRQEYDVALVFSQDQDLSEVAAEIRTISQEQNRWIMMASAYPVSPTYSNIRGINNTQWIRIDRTIYNSCIDPRDYRVGRVLRGST